MIESKAEKLDRLAQEASICTRCPLAFTRQNVVFGEGNPKAPLVFVGEGPGENEDATGRPFVGRAGALLDQILKENGMSRKHIYICNILKCRASVVEGNRIVNRPPRLEEVNACRSWLEQQLAIIQPLVIVCLGAPAANVIIHKNFRMTQERGQWFTSPYAPAAMATYHPAYVLRLQGEAYEIARSLLSADIASARLKVIELKKNPPVLQRFGEEEKPLTSAVPEASVQLSLFDEE